MAGPANDNEIFTPGELAAFQAVFEQAADTLGERVLRNARLEWRPKDSQIRREIIKKSIKAVHKEYEEYQKRHGKEDDATGRKARLKEKVSHLKDRAKPHLDPKHLKQKLTPGKTSRVASRPGTAGGAALSTGSAAEDYKVSKMRALKIGGDGNVMANTTAFIMEGVEQGVGLATTSGSEFKATMDVGYSGEPTMLQTEAVECLADVVRSSGLVEAAAVEGMSGLATEVLSCLPLLGAITNLGKGACYGIMGGRKWYHAHKITKHSADLIRPGAPAQSIAAVRELLERKRTEYMIKSATNAAAGGAQTAGLFVDFGAASGPAVGVAKAAALMAESFFLAARDYRELKKGNELISRRPIDLNTLLKEAPLVGAYLITEAETSTLLAMLMRKSEMKSNWMNLVEDHRKELEYIYERANSCQRDASFVLAGTNSLGTRFKGEHFLDQRKRNTHKRLAWQIKMIARRDPGALASLTPATRRKMDSLASS